MSLANLVKSRAIPGSNPKPSSNKRKTNQFQLAMLLPALIVLVAINFLPIVDTFITSLQSYYLPKPDARHFIGFQNYINLFQDARFLNSLKLTLIYTVAVVIMETALGFIIALMLSRQTWGSNFIRGVLLLPIILTPITVAFMWRLMFNPTLGILNYFLGKVGIPAQLWIFSPDSALVSLMLVDLWQQTPQMILIFVTGLLTLPEEVLEAAMIDGASAWQTLWRIKVPLIKPVLMVGILFRTIDTAKVFDILFILTRGGPGTSTETLSLFAYMNGFSFLKMGYSAASAIILFVVIFVLAQTIMRVGKVQID